MSLARYARGMKPRKGYPSDVSDEEWAFVAPYLTLMTEEAPQREPSLRAVFNGLRWLVRAGAPWRLMPNDLPPWAAVYQQTQRWLMAGVFEAIVQDLREMPRVAQGRQNHPSAIILDSRTLQSTPTSGARAGYDGAKRRRGSKVHLAVDTLGQVLALPVTPAHEQDRMQVKTLVEQIPGVTGDRVEVAFVDLRIYCRATPTGCRRARDQTGGDQATGDEEGLRPAASALGSRAQYRMGRSLSPLSPRL